MNIDRLKKIHYSVHIKNPDINYVLLENCSFCKLDRRESFGREFKTPRTLDAMRLTPFNYSNLPRITNYTNNNPINTNDRIIRNYYNSTSTLNTNNLHLHTNHNIYNVNNSANTNNSNNRLRRYNTYRLPNRISYNQIRNSTPTRNDSDTESETVYGFGDLHLEDVRVKTYLEDVNNNSSLLIYDKIIPHTCPICKDNIKFCNIVRKLDCSHIFHHKCIDTWLEDHSTCPLCRYQLKCNDY